MQVPCTLVPFTAVLHTCLAQSVEELKEEIQQEQQVLGSQLACKVNKWTLGSITVCMGLRQHPGL